MKYQVQNRPNAVEILWLAVVAAVLALGLASPAAAQVTRGSISGVVVDTSGAVVAKATISIMNTDTRVVTSIPSQSDGVFVFPEVLPGPYTVTVEASGFEKLEKTNVNVLPGQRFALGELQLQVGRATQTVTVTAQGTPVELDNAARDAAYTPTDVDNIPTEGRNYVSLINLMPGAIGDVRFIASDHTTGIIPNFNGVTNNFSGTFQDGVQNKAIENPQYTSTGQNVDVVSEIKVNTSNYNAEYGGDASANIQVTTKSGTTKFHGDLYYYNRNEALEANTYLNNLSNVKTPRDRYNDFGGTIGGPIYWPGKFNSGKDKLFFFVGEEYAPSVTPTNGLQDWTMPTAQQISGDFSQTFTLGGALIPIYNPFNGHTQFTGNVIPQNLISTAGQNLLKLFPAPNFTSAANQAVAKGNYNFIWQQISNAYSLTNFYKVDYDPTNKLRLWFDVTNIPSDSCAPNVFSPAWPELGGCQYYNRLVPAIDVSYMFSPSVVNEFNLGMNDYMEDFEATGSDVAHLNRANAGVNIFQFYPQNNGYNSVPNASFSGVPGNPAAISVNRQFPARTWAPVTSTQDTLTWVRGTHTMKAGAYFCWDRNETNGESVPIFNGSFSFQTSSTNPYDSNFPYANALLGTYYSYTESNSSQRYDIRGDDLEWFLQDTWKATRRLTLNYGMRFFKFTPWYQANEVGLNFDPAHYNPAQAVTLYAPVLNSGQRVAENPLTGQLYPPGFIGAIVPGSGNITNGEVNESTAGVPRGFIFGRGIQLGPRAGFAYALTNDDKTVLRGGFGIGYDGHDNDSLISQTVYNSIQNFSSYYGTFSTLGSAPTAIFPVSISALNPHIKEPTVYSESLGVQRELPYNIRLDVAYVGTIARHLDQSQSAFNTVPVGAEFAASNQDPTEPGSPLPDNFFRPYMGYSGITEQQTVNSNYNSLQVVATRHFAKGLTLNASYTYSKTMGYISPFATYYNNKLQYAATAIDRTHVFNGLFVYGLPRFSQYMNNFLPARVALDSWQVSGITSFNSGYPQSLTCGFTYSVNLYGGGDLQRCITTGNPELPKSQRTFYHFLNTTGIAPPTATNHGNAAPGDFRGPGINNWDVSIFKNFPFGEKRYVQFRWEMYNAWNHPSFYLVNGSATFNQAGAQTNAGLGEITGGYTARLIQVALKIYF